VRHLLNHAFVGLVAVLALTACGGEAAAPAEPPHRTATSTADFMEWILDPAADVIWGSAGTITTLEGEENLAPTTDAQWDLVRNAAALVAESGNLLMLPGRAVDDGDWMELSENLITVGGRAMAAAEARDADQLFEIGGQIYNVCLACHQRYIVEDGDGAAN
jgi:hypothetical protein